MTAFDFDAHAALGQRAMDIATRAGASWGDARLALVEKQDLGVRSGRVSTLTDDQRIGFGVRVIVDGAFGFASGVDPTPAEVERVTELALSIARAGRRAGPGSHRWADEPAHAARWSSTWLVDPFDVPVEDKLSLLERAEAGLRGDDVTSSSATMSFLRESQVFVSTAGARIDQTLLRSGAGLTCTAHRDGETQTRSYPAAFGGLHMASGYELVESLDLAGAAERTREEARELLTAVPCPIGRHDVVLSGDQLALQIHESVGHPTELDRVQGWEENFAGSSFVHTDKLQGDDGKGFRYGSEIVQLVADGTVPGGLATVGYDDDGVASQRWHVVENGRFKGYLTSRDTAHFEGAPEPLVRSRGCARAQGPSHVPIVRITNLSLMPGAWTFDDLVADTEDGIYMDGVKCWSIDQQRLNFQFTCEYGWEIKNGKRGRVVKNPTYQGITPEFWGSCDAICGPDDWVLWGVPNCGKGQPMQVAEMSHGAAPARFRGVEVGVRT